MNKIDLYCPVRLYHLPFDPIDKYFEEHQSTPNPDAGDGIRTGCAYDIQNAKHVRELLDRYLISCNTSPSLLKHDSELAGQIEDTSFNIEVKDSRLWLHICYSMKDDLAENLDIDRIKMATCGMLEKVQGNLVRHQTNKPVLVLFEASNNWFNTYNRWDLPDTHFYKYNALLTESELPQTMESHSPARECEPIRIYKLNPYRKDYQDVKEYVNFYGMQPKPEAYLLDWEGDCRTNDLLKVYAMSHLEPVDGMPKLEYGDVVMNGDGCFFLTRGCMARGGTFQPVDSFDPAMIKKAPQCRFGYDLTYRDRTGMPSHLLKVADELDIPYGYDGYPDYHGSRKGEQSFEKGSYEDHQSPCYLHPAYYSGQKGEQFIQRLTALTRLTVWDEVLADLKNNKPVLLQDIDRVESQVPDLLAKKLGTMFGLSSTDEILKGWMQFSEETAEVYETTKTEFLDRIIHNFQGVSERYGLGIAYMIYRNIDNSALLPSEFEHAAKYLHSGGTIGEMTDMAKAGVFLEDTEQSCEQDHAGFTQQQSM